MSSTSMYRCPCGQTFTNILIATHHAEHCPACLPVPEPESWPWHVDGIPDRQTIIDPVDNDSALDVTQTIIDAVDNDPARVECGTVAASGGEA
ncbi:MAG: hypothetical protein ACLQBX_03575 [Candidatus Limnocylindrales bacterium]